LAACQGFASAEAVVQSDTEETRGRRGFRFQWLTLALFAAAATTDAGTAAGIIARYGRSPRVS